MTLLQRYTEAKSRERVKIKVNTPAMDFIQEVMDVTKKSEPAVRRWLVVGSDVRPDELTQKVLADHFNTTPEELFPRAAESQR